MSIMFVQQVKRLQKIVLAGLFLLNGGAAVAQTLSQVAAPGGNNIIPQAIYVNGTTTNSAANSDAIYIGRGLYQAYPNNTAVGVAALSSTTAAFPGAYDNTAFGYYTLKSVINGVGNTALGVSALQNANGPSVRGNVAIGGYSLRSNLTSSDNVAVGYNSMANGTGGNYNVGVGNGTLLSSTANYNTALGYQAMTGHVTGDSNVAIGRGAAVTNGLGSQLSIQNVIYGINMRGGANGNVGIGVVPSGTLAKLEVGGTLKVNTVPAVANTTNTKYLWVDAAGIVSQSTAGLWGLAGNSGTVPGTGASQSFIGTTDAQRLVIATGATEKMTVLTTGAVGIGTAAPAARLDIVGAGTTTVDFQTTGRARIKGNAAGVWFNNLTVDKSFLGIIGSGNPTQALGVYTNGGLWNSFNVMDNGSVSIGAQATNANAKLDVTGNIFANNKVLIGMSGLSALDYTNKIIPYALAVNGDAIFNKVKVKLFVNWPDYVFEDGYGLLPLHELEKYILQHKHLPELPAASEIDKEAIDLGANQVILLQKIEELTLYIIEQNKQLHAQGKQIELLTKKAEVKN